MRQHKWTHTMFKGSDGNDHMSFSTCDHCGIVRKKWQWMPDKYKKTNGETILVGENNEKKVPPCKSIKGLK